MEYICNDCPRNCKVLRNADTLSGFCKSYSLPTVSRAAPHFGEEPCISGTKGSGAVFFSGCNLRCVFCQNREISREASGKQLGVAELRDILLRLRDTGVHNINLVTASHFTKTIAEVLSGIDLGIPVVWNSSGYESADTLKMLDGLVQIYMPDMKYCDSALAKKYSAAPDYPDAAAKAIKEMFRQRGPYVLDDDGIMQSGVLIRHLILPGCEMNTMDVIDFVAEEFPEDSVLFSLMSQYTPMPGNWLEAYPELRNTVSQETADNMKAYMIKRGICSGYWQDTVAATDEMIPAFDGTGVSR